MVLSVCRPFSGEQLAVKQIHIQEELEEANDVSALSLQRVLGSEQIKREVAILASLDHPHVVKFIGFGELFGHCKFRQTMNERMLSSRVLRAKSAMDRQRTSSWSTRTQAL